MLEVLFMYYALGSQLVVPPPTPEQIKLIELMGNDDWHIREKATDDLEALGDKGLGAYEHALNHSSPEVVFRAKGLLNKYYSLKTDCLPHIEGAYNLELTLPSGKEITIPKGLPKYYYVKANGDAEKIYDDNGWHNASTSATIKFIYHMRRTGMSREDVIAVLKAMEEKNGMERGNWATQYNFLDCEEDYIPLPWHPF